MPQSPEEQRVLDLITQAVERGMEGHTLQNTLTNHLQSGLSALDDAHPGVSKIPGVKDEILRRWSAKPDTHIMSVVGEVLGEIEKAGIKLPVAVKKAVAKDVKAAVGSAAADAGDVEDPEVLAAHSRRYTNPKRARIGIGSRIEGALSRKGAA